MTTRPRRVLRFALTLTALTLTSSVASADPASERKAAHLLEAARLLTLAGDADAASALAFRAAELLTLTTRTTPRPLSTVDRELATRK